MRSGPEVALIRALSERRSCELTNAMALATDAASVSYTNLQADFLADVGLHMPQNYEGLYKRQPRTRANESQVWGRVGRMRPGVVLTMCRSANS